MTGGQKVGLGFLIGGVAVAVGGGIALAVASRKSRALGATVNVVQDSLKARPGTRSMRLRGGGAMTPVRTVKSKSGTLREYVGPMPTEDRIRLLQDLVAKGARDGDMRVLAAHITNHCPARDGECEARAVFDWTKANLRYGGDLAPHVIDHGDGKRALEAVDYFQSARRSVLTGAEDCDGHAVMNATLLTLNGITSKFRVTSPTSSAPDQHIYALALLPKNNPSRAISMDTTLPDGQFGTEWQYGRKSDWDA